MYNDYLSYHKEKEKMRMWYDKYFNCLVIIIIKNHQSTSTKTQYITNIYYFYHMVITLEENQYHYKCLIIRYKDYDPSMQDCERSSKADLGLCQAGHWGDRCLSIPIPVPGPVPIPDPIAIDVVGVNAEMEGKEEEECWDFSPTGQQEDIRPV